MASAQQKPKRGTVNKNDNRKNGKSLKQNPGQKRGGRRTGSLDPVSKILIHG